MSVGGKVVEVIDAGDRVWVDTKERQESRQTCAIYVERDARSLTIAPGDSLWWQGSEAYWTARDRAGKPIGKVEIKLKRIGYSGVSKPATAGDYSP